MKSKKYRFSSLKICYICKNKHVYCNECKYYQHFKIMKQVNTGQHLRFIDLFAGLGGFHHALSTFGCRCVFASELKEDLRQLYHINFPNARIEGDITRIDPQDIPAHDILCAGFPCQPFSLAGKRQGFNDEKERGNLFHKICDIIDEHTPRYIMLENVSNLKGHDNGNTWKTIHAMLVDRHYTVKEAILSPHQFGIPQHRRRIYIVCEHEDFGHLENFNFLEVPKNIKCDISKVIDESDEDYMPIKEVSRHQLNVWDEFIRLTVEHGETLPSFPIWGMEFGADYDFAEVAPAFQDISSLVGKHGHLGKIIQGINIEQCLECLPVYARTAKDRKFPEWKIRYISQNRDFYQRNREWLDPWIENIRPFDNSHQKMEWNCGNLATPTLWDKIIQFRPSGIRVKLPTFAPALNLVGTQIPIFPWVNLPIETVEENGSTQGRYMTLREAAKLQGWMELQFDGLSQPRSFAALGNAVNVTIVRHIAKKMLGL